jgi:hypothetical protein
MSARRTYLLAALFVIALMCAAIAFARLRTIASDAIAANYDLRQCEEDLSAISRSGAALHVSSTAPSQPQLERILNDAAQFAGTRLSSIEPGQSDRAPNSDYVGTPIFLRLDVLTLRQLVVFLDKLVERDAACRPKLIELSIPQAADSAPDAWAADVTIAYTSAPARKSR